MIRKLGRLFTIKNRFEAYAVIYAVAVGTVGRGYGYLDQYPGWFGYLLFAACTAAVFMAGAKILDATCPRRKTDMDQRLAERRVEAQGT